MFENSDAEKKGLRLGDIITHINDVSVESMKDFSILDNTKNNQKIKIKYQRENRIQEIEIITNDLFKYVNN